MNIRRITPNLQQVTDQLYTKILPNIIILKETKLENNIAPYTKLLIINTIINAGIRTEEFLCIFQITMIRHLKKELRFTEPYLECV